MKQLSPTTHPLGPGTINRTANLPVDLDRELGRLAHQLNLSKSRLLRRAARGLVSGAVRLRDLGLVLLLGAGLGAAVVSMLQPDTDGMRLARRVRRGGRRIVRRELI